MLQHLNASLISPMCCFMLFSRSFGEISGHRVSGWGQPEKSQIFIAPVLDATSQIQLSLVAVGPLPRLCLYNRYLS